MTDMFDITSPCETPQSDVAYRKMTYRLKRLADDLIRANADINEAAYTVTYHPGWNDTKVAEAIGDEEWGDYRHADIRALCPTFKGGSQAA